MVNCILDAEEEKNKFLLPLRRLRKSKPIEVCLDLKKGEYIYLQDVCKRYLDIQVAYEKELESDPEAKICEEDETFCELYQTMLELIDLWAETCLFRNLYC